MNTTVTFNANKKVKTAAMKKAAKEGLTLTSILNVSLQAYVDGGAVDIALLRDIAKARAQKSIPEAKVRRMLGI